jgi:hypothetical protein
MLLQPHKHPAPAIHSETLMASKTRAIFVGVSTFIYVEFTPARDDLSIRLGEGNTKLNVRYASACRDSDLLKIDKPSSFGHYGRIFNYLESRQAGRISDISPSSNCHEFPALLKRLDCYLD